MKLQHTLHCATQGVPAQAEPPLPGEAASGRARLATRRAQLEDFIFYMNLFILLHKNTFIVHTSFLQFTQTSKGQPSAYALNSEHKTSRTCANFWSGFPQRSWGTAITACEPREAHLPWQPTRGTGKSPYQRPKIQVAMLRVTNILTFLCFLCSRILTE